MIIDGKSVDTDLAQNWKGFVKCSDLDEEGITATKSRNCKCRGSPYYVNTKRWRCPNTNEVFHILFDPTILQKLGDRNKGKSPYIISWLICVNLCEICGLFSAFDYEVYTIPMGNCPYFYHRVFVGY